MSSKVLNEGNGCNSTKTGKWPTHQNFTLQRVTEIGLSTI